MSMSDPSDLITHYSTPAERIVRFLLRVKKEYLKEDRELDREVNFAITNINERRIYST